MSVVRKPQGTQANNLSFSSFTEINRFYFRKYSSGVTKTTKSGTSGLALNRKNAIDTSIKPRKTTRKTDGKDTKSDKVKKKNKDPSLNNDKDKTKKPKKGSKDLAKKENILLKNKKKLSSTAAELKQKDEKMKALNGGDIVPGIQQDSNDSLEAEQYTDQEVKDMLISSDDTTITATTDSRYVEEEVDLNNDTGSLPEVSSDKEFAAGRVGMKYREGTVGARLYEVSTLAEINGFLSLGQVSLLNYVYFLLQSVMMLGTHIQGGL